MKKTATVLFVSMMICSILGATAPIGHAKDGPSTGMPVDPSRIVINDLVMFDWMHTMGRDTASIIGYDGSVHVDIVVGTLAKMRALYDEEIPSLDALCKAVETSPDRRVYNCADHSFAVEFRLLQRGSSWVFVYGFIIDHRSTSLDLPKLKRHMDDLAMHISVK